MRAKQAFQSLFRPGDKVAWTTDPATFPASSDDELPSSGFVLEVRSNPNEYLIQVTPTIIGIYQASQLVRIENSHAEEELLEMLVP